MQKLDNFENELPSASGYNLFRWQVFGRCLSFFDFEAQFKHLCSLSQSVSQCACLSVCLSGS